MCLASAPRSASSYYQAIKPEELELGSLGTDPADRIARSLNYGEYRTGQERRTLLSPYMIQSNGGK